MMLTALCVIGWVVGRIRVGVLSSSSAGRWRREVIALWVSLMIIVGCVGLLWQVASILGPVLVMSAVWIIIRFIFAA